MSATIRKEALSPILKSVKLLNLYPGQRSLITYVQLVVLTILTRCVQFYYAGKLIAKHPDSMVIIASGIRTVCANMQGLKIISFIFYEKEMSYLLNSMEDFWESQETEKIYKICRLFVKGFRNTVYFAFFVLCLLPTVLLGSFPFLLEGDYPVFPYSFWVFSGMLLSQLMNDMWAVSAADCFFMCLSLCTYTQFKLLNARIERLGMDDRIMYSEANICVKYHSFLLKFVETYSSMFSGALFVQYFLASVTICIELFVLPKQDAPHIMLISLIYIVTISTELLMYCIAAQIVIVEAGKVNDAIINSNWYNHPEFAKTYIVNILQRSQKDIIFSAWGIVNINLVALTYIFKMVMSLNTLLSNVEKLFE